MGKFFKEAKLRPIRLNAIDGYTVRELQLAHSRAKRADTVYKNAIRILKGPTTPIVSKRDARSRALGAIYSKSKAHLDMEWLENQYRVPLEALIK